MSVSEVKAILEANQASINFLSALAVAIATIVLAILTARYVRLTKDMLGHMQSSKEPNVLIDFEMPDPSRLRFVVTNYGQSPATNIRFEVVRDVEWVVYHESQAGVGSLPIISSGIKYLAPGRVLKFMLHYRRPKEASNTNSQCHVRILYQNESGKNLTKDVEYDLSVFESTMYESFRDSSDKIADAIEKADRRSGGSAMLAGVPSIYANRGKKSCPFCKELVVDDATKCHHCMEFIKNQVSGTE